MQQRLELAVPPDLAFDRLKSAAGEVGQVKDVSSTTRSLRVEVPTGPLKKLRIGSVLISRSTLRASVFTSQGDGSVIEINGPASVDPHGHERGAINTLVEALG